MQSLSPEPLLSEEDYGAIEAAVMETARGRWFLAEYARRNRNTDTEAVLTAIRRLERLVHSAGTFDARDEVARGMADIAQAIAAAQSSPAILDVRPEETADAVQEDPAPAPDVIEPAATAEEALDLSAATSAPGEPTQPTVEAVREVGVAGVDQGWEGLELAAIELASLGLPPELESSEESDHPLPAAEEPAAPKVAAVTAQSEIPVAAGGAATQGQDLFPILELDEEATDALLTLDVPRQELILPTNHLATQRWHRELTAAEDGALPSHRLDKWAAISAGNDGVGVAPGADEEHDKVLDMVAVVEEALEPAPTSGLVTFIDEEPVEEERSIFTAPLRLEPEAAADLEAEPVGERRPTVATAGRQPGPRLTISEIEAMPFAKKAALFS